MASCPGRYWCCNRLTRRGYALEGGPQRQSHFAMRWLVIPSAQSPVLSRDQRHARRRDLQSPPTAACRFFMSEAALAGVVAGTHAAGDYFVSTTPVVVWSSGEMPRAAASADEAQNPHLLGGSADRIFVSRLRGIPAVGEFDDQVTWIPIPRSSAAWLLPASCLRACYGPRRVRRTSEKGRSARRHSRRSAGHCK